MKFDVIVLAGGLGTRLASVVSDLPKPMAPVAGKPFLDYILRGLPHAHVGKLILAVGHKYKTISDYYGDTYQHIPIVYSIEETPMGTGGGIALAMQHVEQDSVLILNGDTFFDVNYEELWQVQKEEGRLMTLALKQMQQPDRYGTVLLQSNQIIRFQEKQAGLNTGLINGGVYWANKDLINELPKMDKFSFESEVLEVKVKEQKLGGYISEGMFIDIGIPNDYERAQELFAE